MGLLLFTIVLRHLRKLEFESTNNYNCLLVSAHGSSISSLTITIVFWHVQGGASILSLLTITIVNRRPWEFDLEFTVGSQRPWEFNFEFTVGSQSSFSAYRSSILSLLKVTIVFQHLQRNQIQSLRKITIVFQHPLEFDFEFTAGARFFSLLTITIVFRLPREFNFIAFILAPCFKLIRPREFYISQPHLSNYDIKYYKK